MSTRMHVSFQLKKSKADECGKVPIYVRITINGLRAEFSLKRYVVPEKSLSNSGVVKGTNEESKSIKTYLATVRLRLNEQYRFFLEANKPIKPGTIKNAYLGITEKRKTIVEVFTYHNNQVKELLDKDFSFGTLSTLLHCLKTYSRVHPLEVQCFRLGDQAVLFGFSYLFTAQGRRYNVPVN